MFHYSAKLLNHCRIAQNVCSISTGDRPLKENTGHATWGAQGDGQNKLGQLYEELRYNLSIEGLQERLNNLRYAPADISAGPQELSGDIPVPPLISTSSPNEQYQQTPPSRQAPPNNQQPYNQQPSSNGTHSNLQQRTQPDTPPNVTHQSIQNEASSEPPKVALFFGDSNSQGVHPRMEGYIWRTVPVPGGKVCNDAPSKPLESTLSSAMVGDESAIGLHFGTNDALNSDPIQFKQDYRKLVKTARSVNHAVVLCSGIYHRADSATSEQRFNVNRKIDVLNRQIEAVANEEGAIFLDNCVDVGSSVSNPNTTILTNPKYGRKHLHLNPTGQNDLSQRIAAKLSAPIPASARSSAQSRTRSTALNPDAPPWTMTGRSTYSEAHAEDARQWFATAPTSQYPPSRRANRKQ